MEEANWSVEGVETTEPENHPELLPCVAKRDSAQLPTTYVSSKSYNARKLAIEPNSLSVTVVFPSFPLDSTL